MKWEPEDRLWLSGYGQIKTASAEGVSWQYSDLKGGSLGKTMNEKILNAV